MTTWKKCKICSLSVDDRAKVEAHLVLKLPLVDLEKTYGLNRMNIKHHLQHIKLVEHLEPGESKEGRTARIREEDRVRTLRLRAELKVSEDDFRDSPFVKARKKIKNNIKNMRLTIKNKKKKKKKRKVNMIKNITGKIKHGLCCAG